MTHSSLSAMLRLLHASSIIEARLTGEMSAIHGLSVNEVRLLMQLDQAPQRRLPRVELAKRLQTSASTVTRMARPLEQLGFVTRQSDPRDARLAFVVLTETGATRVAEARETLAKQALATFRDRWEDEEITVLDDLLGRLVAGSPGDLSRPSDL